MVFSSLPFLFRFLPVVLLLYFILPGFARNTLLLIASLIFYAWGEPVYVLIMISSTLFAYAHGRIIHHSFEKGKYFHAKIFLVSSIVWNLLPLFFFKYWNFLADTINSWFQASVPVTELALPIGISFYTFQTISYCIDVYRKETPVQKNIIDFGAYVAMFPQLIAGPIVQYKSIASELSNRNIDLKGFSEGVRLFTIGLGKKVLLANQIGSVWDYINAMPQRPVVTAWLGMLAYTFQIYFDFSGYSDMAMGLGRMFGFHFPKNFDYPYESRSVTEFWRRWHITLGSWFRDYVYIPLGGNRTSFGKQIRNILIVWGLTGLWHGASFNFILWGLYYGILLILEKNLWKNTLKKMPALISTTYAFLLAAFGWMLFAAEDLAGVGSYFSSLFGLSHAGFANDETIYLLYTNALLLIILFLSATHYPKKWYHALFQRVHRGQGSVKGKVTGAKHDDALQDEDLTDCQTAEELISSDSKENSSMHFSNMTAKQPPAFIEELVGSVLIVLVFVLTIACLVNASYNPFLYFRF